MAPMISGSKKSNNAKKFKNNDWQNKKDQLLKLRKFVENNFEYVGKNFSRKVREVYYDKKNNKTIYGTTTSDERKQLKEEGIELLSIPWINKDN